MTREATQILEDLLHTHKDFIAKCVNLTLTAIGNTQTQNTIERISWSVIPQTRQPTPEVVTGLIKNCYINIEMLVHNEEEKNMLSAYLSDRMELSFLHRIQDFLTTSNTHTANR
jgi:hypothetical protein